MQDRFRRHSNSPMAPASSAFAVTPSDAVELPAVTNAIYVGGGGDLTVRLLDDQADVVFSSFPAGDILDVRAIAIRATGTTATAIVGLA